jgi:phosphate starvation-inducible protein PhoH
MTVEQLNEVVNHAAVDKTVDRAIIRLQLETASALRDRLDASGGVMLGDEVGAGKTYIAFALIAQALQETPDRGVVILVPSVVAAEEVVPTAQGVPADGCARSGGGT